MYLRDRHLVIFELHTVWKLKLMFVTALEFDNM